MEKLLVGVKEACSLLDCSPTYFYSLVKAGRLKVVKVGRNTKVSTESLREYVRSLSAPPPGAS